jgi:exodeoxyribonuclease VII large subunit
MSEEKQIFTLKQVALSIQKVISERYSRLYWVQAEMHKLNYTNKGHCYPELVQKEDGKIVAEMRGTIWKAQFDKISKSFSEVVKEPLKDGMSLLFLVKISFHPLYGMGLEVVDIDPTFALGELQKEREETLKRLTKDGILNANQRLKFPLLPQRIAVISVDSSKGLSDFYSVVQNNQWNYAFFLMLFTAQLNGDLAVDSIQNQLSKIEKVKHHFDAVAIIRGGGGEIGLSCYNNYELSKAIATFPLPVLTGIGHSTNITVSEMVAFRNAITPTELGEFLIQCFHNFSVPVKDAQKSLKMEVNQFMQDQKIELANELRIFKNVSNQRLFQTHQILNSSTKNLSLHARFRFNNERKVIDSSADQLKSHVRSKRNFENQRINQLQLNLVKHVKVNFNVSQNQVRDTQTFMMQQLPKFFIKTEQTILNLEKNVKLMDPTLLLKRGYSLSLFQGKTINAKNPVKSGDIIETVTFENRITSEVKEIKKEDNE